MSFLVCEELSPSQMGPATTTMSASLTAGYSSGHSSVAQPCSRMSGYTPLAMSWSTVRMTRVATPCFSMISRLMVIRPSVLLVSGERFSVPLKYRALRSL
jgi:hypothetical protein